MMRLILIILISNFYLSLLGQYHPTPTENQIDKLKKISEKAYNKSRLGIYETSIIIYYGDLGCDDMLNDREISKSLLQEGIKFGYYRKKKCFFKNEKYLAADIYYLDQNGRLLGYYDGQIIYPSIAKNGDTMLDDVDRFINYLNDSKYSSFFHLSCLDGSLYYAVDSTGSPVLINEYLFSQNENPMIYISELE